MTVWMTSEMLPMEIVLEQSWAHLKPCSGYPAESLGVSPGGAQAGAAENTWKVQAEGNVHFQTRTLFLCLPVFWLCTYCSSL